MAESSSDRWEYEAKVARRFGFEQQLELPIPLPTEAQKYEAALLVRPPRNKNAQKDDGDRQ
jgi:hypothetical protein